MKLFSMFTGYGGCCWGLKKANIDYELIGYSEVDKYASQCFEQNFPEAKGKNFGSCKEIDPKDLPDFDLLTGGFPCQDVSIAGKRDLTKGRTMLINDVFRIAKEKKPKYIVLENVKGLLSMGDLFQSIRYTLDNLGYGVLYKVLNSKEHGIPQNRERVWIICKLGGWDFMEFQYPEKEELKVFVKDILEENVNKKYYLSKRRLEHQMERLEKGWNIQRYNKDSKTVGCIHSGYYKLSQQQPYIVDKPKPNVIHQHRKDDIREYDNIVPTLLTGDINSISIVEEIRKSKDPTKAFEEAEKLSEKTGDPVQLDLWHLFSGDIRPLSTYIPQDTKVHRCLQAGEPKELLVLGGMQEHQIPRKDGVCPGLMASMGTGGGNNPIIIKTQYGKHQQDCYYDSKGIMGSIPAGTHGSTPHLTKTKLPNGNIRKLTPKECFRLMGFLNDEIDLKDLSDTQCYKLAGNGWDINVVSKIFKNMFKEKQNEK